MARGVKGICPEVTSSPDPTIRTTWADALYRDIQRLEHSGRQALLFTQQAKQDVLGADVVVLQRARLVLGEDDDLASPLCEPFEQPCGPFDAGGRLLERPS